ncbi:DUF2156 domain-containing protein [Faecalicatena sp. AGMB00832]|uniref:DUF2156 domain-containing protein n=1 Tax=Faecalicatena faecalis TaxID=2726362 RepID=A0ABS6D2N9_9FIRM|nr:phosphatidylglycerol lysyltransferase domain-containing protein [Faecalicatena faecalis]MBU3875472.1 DUF2156 domain-containing protein [Faecalicatena faecalis]
MDEIKFKRPELEDREIISSYFAKAPSRSCERTFANVYLWSRHYHVKYAVIEDALIFQDDEVDLAFAYPAGEPQCVKNALEFLTKYSQERGYPLKLYNVTQENFAQLEAWYPGEFQVEYIRDAADYVYESEKLATLPGKKLHSKRNHINKFKSLYPNWSYESLSEANQEECFQMALKWRNQNGCDEDPEKNAEMCVTLNSLRLYKELGQTGGVLRIDDKIAAFAIGEPISEDTFVVHIEKAFPHIDGAYPMINQQFVLHECMDYKYVNREEDTGAEGLRKAKMSYRPAFMVEKGIVTKK